MLSILAVIGCVLWVAIWLAPWKPWMLKETLDASSGDLLSTEQAQLLHVIMPARNEAEHIIESLESLGRQADRLDVILVDDESTDGTAAVVAALAPDSLNIRTVRGQPRPAGWNPKTWALQQGLAHSDRPWVLLLDADIIIEAGLGGAMGRMARDRNVDLINLLPAFPMRRRWEKLLFPTTVFFYRLFFPFALSNQVGHSTAAAAGGCLLVRRSVLDDVGAFESVRNSHTMEAALVRMIKGRYYRSWTGVTRSAVTTRSGDASDGLEATLLRALFPLMHHSLLLLILFSGAILLLSCAPPVAMLISSSETRIPGLIASTALVAAMLPIFHYYHRSPLWILALPLAGIRLVWLAWQSAILHRRKRGVDWRGRIRRSRPG